MKRPAVVMTAIALAVLLVLALPAAASSPHPFRGDWKAIDGDGSNLSLSFVAQSRSGGRVFNIHGFDDSCTSCGGAPAGMEGVGVLDGENTINASFVWWTVPTGDPVLGLFDGSFTYDPDTNTVTDPDGIVYHRNP